MRSLANTFAIAVVLLLVAVPAAADWYTGDPYKMHYPQEPDPNGWDIELFAHDLADDWQCTQSGPVTNIHFWTSWLGDYVGEITELGVSICEDGGTEPGAELWSRVFTNDDFEYISPYGFGLQSFYSPEGGLQYGVYLDDHFMYQQVNIENIDDPFIQTAGDNYWLVLTVGSMTIPNPPGWKTSQDHFGDVPVWFDWYEGAWVPLHNPLTGDPFSMAFVVAPEPAGLVLIVLGGLPLLRRLR